LIIAVPDGELYKDAHSIVPAEVSPAKIREKSTPESLTHGGNGGENGGNL
jgi:hypothetical protein